MTVQRLGSKVAIVSGSGRGIGRAVAEKLAREGARVVVNDLDPEPAKETVAAIEAFGGQAVACVGSVTDADFAERFVNTAVEAFGGLDIIVNNAGYTWDNVIQKMTDQQWQDIMDVHLTAPFRILRAAQPVISAAVKKARAEGLEVPCRKVVNTSSLSGIQGNPGQVNYSTAKAGLLGMTRTLAKEWGRYNVTVNAVAYGIISTRLTAVTTEEQSIDIDGRNIKVGVNPQVHEAATQQIALGRAGTAEEAAGAVYMLCSPESNYITGETLVCGGGL
ncbi:SDR family oxidoreductase [Streptomyces hirsutus]|uniref:SDR family NAD(P)-dependent oxidoreductase n=1 Tax=Streptomyces hirsutus TaxID=35620 RepID=UPI0034268E2A